MGLQHLGRAITAALLAVTSVQASPYLGAIKSLESRDIFAPATTCDDFVYGSNNIYLGKICVSLVDGILTVNYPLITPAIYKEVHVYVGTTAPTDKAPGKFPYKYNNGYCNFAAGNVTATCTIPVDPTWRACDQTLYIATHAAIVSGTSGDTAWGAGTCFGSGSYLGNCAKYWSFQTQCFCRSTSSPPPITYSSTSYSTITSTSTSEWLTSSTSVTTFTVTSSSIILYTTTSSTTTTTTTSSILYSTTTPAPITTTVTCRNPASTGI